MVHITDSNCCVCFIAHFPQQVMMSNVELGKMPFTEFCFFITNPLLTSSCNILASFNLPRKLIKYGRSDFQAGHTLLLSMA